MGTESKPPKFLLIDLFCGAGGTTTGAINSGVCKVIAAVNHDPLAIETHAANHDDVLHMTEDILVADIQPIREVIAYWKSIYPDASVVLWASLECTNFSNAKGGLPRDADSRALAQGMFRYLEALDPEYFLIENVKEFMAWGELDENGKPISKLNGRDYLRWIKRVQSYDYKHDWRMLCAADYGGVTIRERYFGAFWKPGKPFAWPARTHAKKPAKGNMFSDDMKPWRAVAEVLDFSDLGTSIFDRKRPPVDKTLLRLLAGLKKFNSQPQIMICNSPGYCTGINRPIPTLTTVNSKALVTPLIMSYYSGSNCVSSSRQPAPTVTTKDRMALVSPWIYRDFKNATNRSINQPAGALLTVPKMNLCSVVRFLDINRAHIKNGVSVERPIGTITTNPVFSLATAFIVNPQYTNKGNSVHAPAPTVIATQKSRPLSLATATINGEPKWIPSDADSPAMTALKSFMKENGIVDIYLRMLKVTELKRIQGFPDNYVLKGPQDKQKKFIGNSVETGVVKTWLRAMAS